MKLTKDGKFVMVVPNWNTDSLVDFDPESRTVYGHVRSRGVVVIFQRVGNIPRDEALWLTSRDAMERYVDEIAHLLVLEL